VDVSLQDLQRMRTWVTPGDADRDFCPIILAAWQSLASHRGTETVFYGWAHRSGRIDTTSSSSNQQRSPLILPWARPDLWSRGVWAVCIQVLRRFLRQYLPGDEATFRASLEDLREFAGYDSWVIRYIVMTYYFVESGMYLWPTVFCPQGNLDD